MEKIIALEFKSVENLRALLRDTALDVNWKDENERGLIHHASWRHWNIAKLTVLLTHPDIDVNLPNREGFTALGLACFNGNVETVRILLMDSRVDATLAEENHRTPLWMASCCGHLDIIELLITSGKALDVSRKGKLNDQDFTALEIARVQNKPEIVPLLEHFMACPLRTRHELRVRFGVLDAQAAGVFALTIFLCDGLLRPKPLLTSNPSAVRFFSMAKRVPMELQMILCHLAVGSLKENIVSKDAEGAFMSLAATLLMAQHK